MILRIPIFLFMVILLETLPTVAQESKTITVVVKAGDGIRDLAARYLDDANLWQEILRSNGLQSPADIKPGMRIKIIGDYVALSKERLTSAHAAISKATELGARVFVEKLMSDAIATYDQAVEQRRKHEWQRAITLALDATAKAEKASEQTVWR